MKTGRPFIDYTNQKFQMLTFIKYDHRDGKNTWWKVRCDCGTEKLMRTGNVRNPNNVSCGCHGRKSGPSSNAFHGVGEIGHCVFHRIKALAKRRKILFEITIEYAWELFQSQNGCCALTGTKIILPTNYKPDWHVRFNGSLDRIDSSQGYIKENVQWVLKKINMMKQAYTQSEFIDLCTKVAKYRENKV